MEIKINFSEMSKFEIDFEKINELWEQDYGKATMEVMKDHKQHKLEEFESYACDHGQLRTYLTERIYPSIKSGYFIIEFGQMTLKQKDSWSKVEKKIKCKSQKLYKMVVEDCARLYKPEVCNDDLVVNSQKKQINLALPMNYVYDKTAKVDEVNGKRILDFIEEVIANNTPVEWECIKYIMGCIVHRKRSELIAFLQGLGGIGKTFFADIISALVGKAFAKASEAILSGESEFNNCLIGASAVLLEETSGTSNYAKLMRGLKETSTATEITARMMYSDGFPVNNILNIIVLSNHYRDLDCSDRRIFVPTLNNKYQNDKVYFKDLYDCQTPEALQYVFNYFYEVDISKKMEAPLTEAKKDYKLANMSNCIQFVIENYMVKHLTEVNEVKLSEAYKQYTTWAQSNDIKAVAKMDYFTNILRQYISVVEKDGKPKQKDHTTLYDLSTPVLIEKIITRSKVITDDQYKEMLHAHGNKRVDMIVFDGDVREKEEMVNQIKLLQQLLKDKDKRVDELEQLLTVKKEKKVKVVDDEEFDKWVDDFMGEKKLENKPKKIHVRNDLTKHFNSMRNYLL